MLQLTAFLLVFTAIFTVFGCSGSKKTSDTSDSGSISSSSETSKRTQIAQKTEKKSAKDGNSKPKTLKRDSKPILEAPEVPKLKKVSKTPKKPIQLRTVHTESELSPVLKPVPAPKSFFKYDDFKPKTAAVGPAKLSMEIVAPANSPVFHTMPTQRESCRVVNTSDRRKKNRKPLVVNDNSDDTIDDAPSLKLRPEKSYSEKSLKGEPVKPTKTKKENEEPTEQSTQMSDPH